MKLYKYDIRNLTDAEYNKWFLLMSVEKQQRVDRFRFENDKKRTVAGEMLARKAISEWCNIEKNCIVFNKSKYGKPYAVGLSVEFNISHSGDMVVCAVGNVPVGIDIEQIRPIDLSVAKHICKRNELLYIFGGTPNKKDFCFTTNCNILTRFFEIWTKKEALLKCEGKGLSLHFPEIDNKHYIVKTILCANEKYVLSICCHSSNVTQDNTLNFYKNNSYI